MRSNLFKRALICAVVAFFSLEVFAMGEKELPENAKKNVAVTFDAMYELTKAVAKDKVNISVIIPEGMEPHDFERKAKDLAFLSKADVLVYNGLNMEFWLDEAVDAVKNEKLIKVEATHGVKAIKANHEHHHDEGEEEHHDEHHHDEGEEEHHHGHHHHHGEFDPHAWLGLSCVKIMVQNIADGLAKADKDNAKFYQANAKTYIAKIDKLLNEYKAKFKTVKQKHFVTGHAAFAYLCRDFNLEQNAVKGVFSEGEPNAKQLAHLVEYCKKHKIKTIFAEEAASPEVSKTLANEVNAKVEEIYTLETPKDNKNYLERMQLNLERIYKNIQ